MTIFFLYFQREYPHFKLAEWEWWKGYMKGIFVQNEWLIHLIKKAFDDSFCFYSLITNKTFHLLPICKSFFLPS